MKQFLLSKFTNKKISILFVLVSMLFTNGLYSQVNTLDFEFMSGLNNPFGSETPFEGYYFNREPFYVDIDADGDLDIFTIKRETDFIIAFLKNTGSNADFNLEEQTGVNNPFSEVLIPSSNYSPFVSFADIDNDTDLDAFIWINGGTFRYFKNIGTSTFPEFSEITGNDNPLNGITSTETKKLDFVDIDDDGDLDVFIDALIDYPHFYKNTGNATSPIFESQTDNFFDISTSEIITSFSFSDIDNDNDYDVLIATAYGVMFFKNSGTVTNPIFERKTGVENPFYYLPFREGSKAKIIDFDSDNDLDVIFYTYDELFILYFENIGTPESPVFEDRNYKEFGEFSFPIFVDIDADNDFDLFIGRVWGEPEILFFKNTGTSISPFFEIQEGTTNPFNELTNYGEYIAPEFIDIDNDGDYDCFVGNEEAEKIKFYKNIGSSINPIFELQTIENNPLNIATDLQRPNLEFVDFDNDNDYDCFVSDNYYNENHIYYINNGTNIAPSFELSTNPLSTNSNFNSVEFEDLDHDNDFDAILGCYREVDEEFQIKYFENIGNNSIPNFEEQIENNNPFLEVPSLNYVIPAFVDIDNDGDKDLFLGDYTGSILFYKNNDNSVAINENAEFELSIYPNPTNNITNINLSVLEKGSIKIELYDISGRKILQESINNKNITIDLKNCNAGMYILHISQNNKIYVSKIIKK